MDRHPINPNAFLAALAQRLSEQSEQAEAEGHTDAAFALACLAAAIDEDGGSEIAAYLTPLAECKNIMAQHPNVDYTFRIEALPTVRAAPEPEPGTIYTSAISS